MWVLDIVLKRPGQTTFEVQKWRWVVERTFGWFGRYRRLSKDCEHNPDSSGAWISIAMIHRLSRFDLPDKNEDDDLMSRPPKSTKSCFLNGQSSRSLCDRRCGRRRV